METLTKLDELYDRILNITRDLSEDHHEVALHFEREYTTTYDKLLANFSVGNTDEPDTVRLLDRLAELTDQLEKVVKINELYRAFKRQGE